jgi:N-acetylglucosaminyldiphosphoundecaprenol N-acetyl-beta-D-mannosaminyltransferase
MSNAVLSLSLPRSGELARPAPCRAAAPSLEEFAMPESVDVWGVPFATFTFQQTLSEVERLIHRGQPSYFTTVNLHSAMLAHQDAAFREILRQAAFNLADGMPVVWASRWREKRIPERVTGADVFPGLCELAARKGYRIFLLGGAPGVADRAAQNLRERFPALQIAGVEAPPFRPLSAQEHAALVGRIRAARPDLLFVAFGQPKGEIWLHQHYQALGVPVSVQIGATLDFMAGRVQRSPRWLQRLGLEWAYRLYQEPGRLFFRYAHNATFLLRMLARDAASLLRGRGRRKKRAS